MQGFVDGVAPAPAIYHLTGMRPSAAGHGTSEFELPATGWLAGPSGHILGGTLAVLADGPLGCAIQTTLPAATGYTTAELSLSYLRPAVPDGTMLTARGRCVHGGRSLALSEVMVYDGQGRALAHGTSRCFVFPPAPISDPVPEPPVAELPDYPTPNPFERAPLGAVTPPEAWSRLSGLELLQGWIAGELPLPPIYHLTGQRPIATGEGTATFAMPASGWLASPAGTVEGGFLAMLADAAAAGAVQSTVPAGSAFTPTDITVKFVRPVPPDGGQLVAEARVLHRGRSMAVAEAQVRNAEGKLVCTALGSALILPGRAMSTAIVPDDEAVSAR